MFDVQCREQAAGLLLTPWPYTLPPQISQHRKVVSGGHDIGQLGEQRDREREREGERVSESNNAEKYYYCTRET